MTFPPTRPSLIEAARGGSDDARRRALEQLAASYRAPVVTYLGLRWRAAGEAEDLAQGFFADALDRGLFERYDPARARLRTFLRVALDGFAANQRKADARQKRGGGAEHVALDGDDARDVAGEDPDRLFRREWVRALFERALDDLRAACRESGKGVALAIFERYDLDPPGERVTYEQLAALHGVPATQVTNHLAWARREFRRLVLERLRDATGSEDEFRAEAREILGVDPL